MTRSACSIVPPFILERLAHSPDEELAAHARHALRVDRRHRAARADRADEGSSRRPLEPGTIEGGPSRLICDAHNTEELPGTTVRDEGQEPTGDLAVDEAYDGLGQTWALYAQAFARNSLDGKGLPLRATVHFGDRYDNAFWDGTQMVFGDGDGKVFGRFTASLDVIGHELAHGVTEHTAGLMYQDQPGALNESMSDVFGSLVKQHKLGQDAAAADWLIGAELLIGELAGQALRAMKAPGTAYDNPVLGKDPQPAHMDDYVRTDADHGGVHINSGIPNKAFYLVATTLGGPAWGDPGAIWYAALTGKEIAADCDFVTFAGLTQGAARALFGEDSPQLRAVTEAWSAVGVLGSAGPAAGSGDPADEAAADEPGQHEPSPDDHEHEGEPVPADAVVALQRSGGFAGLTVRRTVTLEELPAPDAHAWRSVLRARRLQALGDGEPTHPDSYCYGVSCERPAVDVQIAEQHLPDDLKGLFERTLREG